MVMTLRGGVAVRDPEGRIKLAVDVEEEVENERDDAC